MLFLVLSFLELAMLSECLFNCEVFSGRCGLDADHDNCWELTKKSLVKAEIHTYCAHRNRS